MAGVMDGLLSSSEGLSSVSESTPVQDNHVSSKKEESLKKPEGGEWEWHALLAYDASDERFAFTVSEEMEEKRGFKLYIPERDMLIGALYNQEIAEVALKCKAVLFLISSSFNGNERNRWVLFSIHHNIYRSEPPANCNLIPILLEPGISKTELLGPHHGIDITKQRNFKRFWDKLEETLSSTNQKVSSLLTRPVMDRSRSDSGVTYGYSGVAYSGNCDSISSTQSRLYSSYYSIDEARPLTMNPDRKVKKHREGQQRDEEVDGPVSYV